MRLVHLFECVPLKVSGLNAGIAIDGKTVFTSDHALKLDWIPNWIAIIGSGYIGLEFSDVYTALGSEVTFIEVPRDTINFSSVPVIVTLCWAWSQYSLS